MHAMLRRIYYRVVKTAVGEPALDPRKMLLLLSVALPDAIPSKRTVCFNGYWTPSDAFAINEAPWITKHWRID